MKGKIFSEISIFVDPNRQVAPPVKLLVECCGRCGLQRFLLFIAHKRGGAQTALVLGCLWLFCLPHLPLLLV